MTKEFSGKTDLIIAWGWTEGWALKAAAWRETNRVRLGDLVDSAIVGRVTGEQRDYLEVVSERGSHRAEVKGRLRKHEDTRPTVGDWVVLDINNQIEYVLERKTTLRRKAAGESEEIQILAANVDWVFVATSINRDFNIRKIERFAVAARDSGADVAIILTKSDLGETDSDVVQELRDRLPETPIYKTSALEKTGIENLRLLLKPSKTAVFLGSSGVGKSSLVNSILRNETQVVSEIRSDDDKGRHTTTGRSCFLVESGGVIIDTPGIRELQLADGAIRVEDEFHDVEELALQCKFTNCRHETEKGCAIRAALDSGDIDSDRLDSYNKLKAEVAARAKRRR